MSFGREEAVARANELLKAQGSTMVALEENAHPNPYQDLWLVDPVDPDHPDEELTGGGPVVVPADGEVYEIDSVPPRSIEWIGTLAPPDDEWD